MKKYFFFPLMLWAELLGMPVPEIRTTRPGHEVKEIYRGKPSEEQVVIELLHSDAKK